MPTTRLQQRYRYSHTIGFYAQIGRGFNNPVDVAVRRDGVLYVLNRAGADTELRMIYKRVTICTVDEEYRGEFSSGGTGDGQIMWPVAIALDQDDNLYISDEALQRISILTSRGNSLPSGVCMAVGRASSTILPGWPLIGTAISWWSIATTIACRSTPGTGNSSGSGAVAAAARGN
jgi:hypothetical protein